MNESQTHTDLAAALAATAAVGSAIKDLGQVREGTLYAAVMGVMNLVQFTSILDCLVRQNLIRRDPGFLLVWVGGE